LISGSIDDLPAIARKIAQHGKHYSIWLLQGEMGAGKTTLIKNICQHYKVMDNVSSPTFSIVNEYKTSDDQIIFHFDFYRINDESEALDMGIDEYFDSGNLCLIEWPDKIASLLPDKYQSIYIEPVDEQKRRITLSNHG